MGRDQELREEHQIYLFYSLPSFNLAIIKKKEKTKLIMS